MPKVHLVHPKFLSDGLLAVEHDFLHKLFESLSSEKGDTLEHPDAFRYNGRRGQLYIRHRKLAEEMDLRAIEHTTPIDRKQIEVAEWSAPEVDGGEILKEADELREDGRGKGYGGRVPLPSTGSAEDYTCPDDFTSVILGVPEDDILVAMWRIMRFLVMERSYSRFRSLAELLQGKRRGSIWILFDLMLEEAYAHPHDERAPSIAYESVWEILEKQATEEETIRYKELVGELVPGKVSLDMRRFLASVTARQDNEDLKYSAILAPYIDQ
ncbi:MAG: DUF1722 domain-containing protein [bacterium]|nr:DUF1722 domain-containing protein [bacterium]MDT8396372.1 DUF1722 domain-containing protein [bacterium]